MLETYVRVDLESQHTDGLGDRSRLLDGSAGFTLLCAGEILRRPERCLRYCADPNHLSVEEEVRNKAAKE